MALLKRPRGLPEPAQFWKGWHLAFMIAWLVMVPVAFLTHLASSVPFVTFLSLWALVATEHSAWQGSRAEVKAEDVDVDTHTADVSAHQVRLHPAPTAERCRTCGQPSSPGADSAALGLSRPYPG